jgi:glycosyltransferase involved in cell wall biosynthesis
MRIAIVSANRGKVGGVETYLETAIGGISAAGHQVGFLCEVYASDTRQSIQMPADAPVWCTSAIGSQPALQAMREWRPDLIYAHGLSDPMLEAETQRIAPAAFFAHDYYGACISGEKTTRFPHSRPCGRRFGWPCVLHFYPHRCGGLNPLTMWSDFQRQSRRLQLMRNYRMTITASEHMRSEYLRQGFPPETVRTILPPATTPERNGSLEQRELPEVNPAPGQTPAWRLLYVGRMEALKGAGLLLEALPRVASRLGVPIRLTLASDGRERAKLETKAAGLCSRVSRLEISFTGWLEHENLVAAYRDSDLLVMPSVWPEPFGRVGIEAGMYSLPVAAFAVGGIPEWLKEGVNGHLAPGDAPTPAGLAAAIADCLSDRQKYDRLRIGALTVARQFTLANHMRQLLRVFELVAKPLLNSELARPERVAAADANT